MRNANVTAVSVSSDELKINTNEAALRLKIPRGYESEEIKRCDMALKSVLCCKYAYVRVPVEFKEAGICNLGFGDIEKLRFMHGALRLSGSLYTRRHDRY